MSLQRTQEEEKVALPDEAFEQLGRDFQEVLEELAGDSSLEEFRNEYEKLHGALKRSHETEKRLIKKCRELNSEIVQNAVKVQTALKLSQEDQQRISAMKKEIERAWRMVETSHDKEARADETIQTLKHEAAELTRIVEQGGRDPCPGRIICRRLEDRYDRELGLGADDIDMVGSRFGNVGWDFDFVPAILKMSGRLDGWGNAVGGRVCGMRLLERRSRYYDHTVMFRAHAANANSSEKQSAAEPQSSLFRISLMVCSRLSPKKFFRVPSPLLR